MFAPSRYVRLGERTRQAAPEVVVEMLVNEARILVVEDNPASRRIVLRSLANHRLSEAADGAAALAMLAVQPFDLVLLDVGLPDLDGFELLRQIRERHGLSVMVILVTARGQTAEVVQGFNLGADDYVVKPFRPEELEARVQSALRLKRLQDELLSINHNLESEVRARTDQLLAHERFALLGRNAAQLAHNLNSPLTALMGYIELAIEAGAARQDDLLLRARDVAVEMQAIIARLLRGVRRGEAMAEAGDLDLNSVIEQQLSFWQLDPRFRYRVFVECELTPELPPVRAVAADVNQILTNLIDNALYATQERPSARLRFRTRQVGQEVLVELQDNGIGIPAEHLERIFEPLFTTKPVGEGTGLGLASCYELVTANRGRLEVASELGEGSTFTLALPLG
ncbi:MAG: response regulator [Armatimonadetes bacterium]|nr:response regulator [Armatimonadota bacterium]